MIKAADITVKKEIQHNRKWIIRDAERTSDKMKLLIVEYTQTEVGNVGLANIRKKFEIFQKLHSAGISVLHPHSLLPNFNSSVVIVFSPKPGQTQKSFEFKTIESLLPIKSLEQYTTVILEILNIFWGIHKQGLIHNSISTDGLILKFEENKEARVCLADVGELVTESHSLNNTEISKKELSTTDYKYISPEFIGRTGHEIDKRSDIYSLGVLLYELAVGELPFISATSDPLELLHCHMTKTPPSLSMNLWGSSNNMKSISSAMTSIIHKMMNKAPSERYQSLYGVIRDMELIKQATRKGTPLDSFITGAFDLYDEFHLPNMKLYGRDREIATILKQVEMFQNQCDASNLSSNSVSDGPNGHSRHDSEVIAPPNNGIVVLVGGHSGIGKSSLIRHVFNTIYQEKQSLRKPPVLLEGKHDRLKHTPYSAIIKALGGVIRRLLTMSSEELQWWKESINAALTPNGKVLVDVLPESEAIIGSQAPVPTLPPAETKTRFELVLISFMQVFLSKFTTILFLDDMQWADPSTLSLVESMMTNTSVKNIMLMCAYRDNEVDSSHLFKIVMDDIQKKDVVVNQLILKPLQLEHTDQLIMDSFHCPQAVSLSLAQLVQQKTRGNPFFLGQFLKSITQEKLGTFNYDKHEWEWSLEQLKNVQYTDNVVDFMVAKIRKLPTEVQTAIQLASCLGNTFDLETLFIVSETPREELERCIEAVIAAALVVPHQECRITEAATNETVTVYKFIHDRVQEAFYVMLDVAYRMPTHLKIARLLGETKANENQASDLFFTIAHHYNEAADLVVKLPQDSKERHRMVDLNFEAAKRAKQSSAIESACSYLGSARRVLADDHFTSDYRRSFDIILLLADCQFNMGISAEAEKSCDLLLENATNDHDKIRVYILLATYFESVGNFGKSIDIGFNALKVYGIEVPPNPSTELVEQLKDEVLALQKAKTSSILEIASLPPMSEDYLMLAEVLYTMLPTAYVMSNKTGLNLFYVLVCLGSKLSIEQGPAGVSGNIFAGFVGVLSDFEQYAESYQYALMCYKILEKLPHPSLARTESNCQVFGQWQQETISQGKAVQLSGFRHAVEVGDVNYILYTATNGACSVLGCGEHIDDCEAAMLMQLDTLRNLKRMNQEFVDTIFITSRAFKVLKGTTTELGKFDKDFDYNKFLERMNQLESGYFVCIAFFSLLFTSVIFEDYETALDVQNKTPTGSVNGLFLAYEQIVWRNLLYVAMMPTKEPEQQAIFLEKINSSMKKFEKIKNSPSLHCKLVLIEAELARISGDVTKAQELYDESISLAKDSNCLHVVGYAAEQAMKFYLGRRMDRAATNYFRESRAAYFAWGAFAKTKQLEGKYSFMMTNISNANISMNGAGTNFTRAAPLDLQSVLKACQVLSSEINLTKLLAHMVRIVLQNTGAQKGFFVVPDNAGKLFIEAQSEAGSEDVQSVHLDITDTSAHPVGIVQYTYRTKAPVLLDDAFQGGMFTFDPYVQLNNTKSVLCIPVLGQAKVIGILYVENNLLAGAFTTERLEVLQMISAQMAISFENANLYKTLQMANRMLESKNQELLELDMIKDQFLANTSHELRTPLNGIIGLAEAMIDGATGPLSSVTCNNLAMVANCGRRLANLVNDILDLSALKAGSLSIHPRPSSLKHALNEVLFLSSSLIMNMDLRIIDNTANLPQMNVDEARILQVLQNIVGNAIKFTQKGTITISNDATDQWVRIFITDTGCGIPESAFGTIFEDFKQVDGSLSRKAGGTGLGLSISSRIMELHRGAIKVESKLGVGSKFTILFPQSLVIRDSSVPKKTLNDWNNNQIKSTKEDTSMTILSVNDDPTNQIMIKKLLNNHNIIHAINGDEALEMINTRSTPPDCVLLDFMKPTMPALEMCERVCDKFSTRDLPIIFISTKNKLASIMEGLKRGANDLISKPINNQELLAHTPAQLLVCHSCKTVCKSAAVGNDQNFACETCKSNTPKVQQVPHISLKLVENLLNQLPFMMTLYNLDGKAVLQNTSAKTHFHTLQTHGFLPQILERDLAREILQQVKSGNTVDRVIDTGNRSNEYHKLCAKLFTLLLQGVQTTYILVVETSTTETTQTKHTDEQRKDELISDLVHNLKSPLVGIVALIDAMANEINANSLPVQVTGSLGASSSSSSLLNVLASSARSMSRLMDEIVDYSDIYVDYPTSRPYVNKPLHMGHVMEKVDQVCRPLAIVNNVKITKEVQPNLPPVIANKPKVTMMLSYLIEVCIKYTKSGTIAISVRTAKDGRGVVVCLRDTERTLPPDEFFALFDLTNISNGYLPPAIVRKLADMMGARLSMLNNGIQVALPESCIVQQSPLNLSATLSKPEPQVTADKPNNPPTSSGRRPQPIKTGSSTAESSSVPATSTASPNLSRLRTPTPTPSSPNSHSASIGKQIPEKPKHAVPPLQTQTNTNSSSPSSSQPPPLSPYHYIQSPNNTSTPLPSFKNSNIPPFSMFDVPTNNMASEIKELTTRLAILKSIYNSNQLSVKFRRPDSNVPFFQQVKLELRSLAQLKLAIAKRLQAEPHLISAIVRDGDTLVEQDEDLYDGMQLEVYF